MSALAPPASFLRPYAPSQQPAALDHEPDTGASRLAGPARFVLDFAWPREKFAAACRRMER